MLKLDEINKILKKGHSLQSIGVKNRALSFNEALDALTQFEKLGVPILGGDVCELQNGIFQYNNDNWFCDKEDNESNLDYVLRSVERSKNYILNYNIHDVNKIAFAFVLDI